MFITCDHNNIIMTAVKNAAKCKLAFKFQSLRVIEKCGEHFMAIKVNIIINN